MSDRDLKIDSSKNGKVTIIVKDGIDKDKYLTGLMLCDENDKPVLLQQFKKLLNDPKMIGFDFFDWMPVFERGCTFKSQVFGLDENVYKATVEWIKALNIPADADIVIWADGEPTMMQFNDLIQGMYDAADLDGDVMFSFNGETLGDGDQIRFSVWY